MSKTNVKKQAEKDAREYAAAYMSYGQGAGTRRKLIEGTVDYKIYHIPGYEEEFRRASQNQNMAEHAKNAKRENRRKTVNDAVVRNTRAVATGRYENVSTGILLFGATAALLHKTGYDKKIFEFSKKNYNSLRQKLRRTTCPKTSGKSSDNNVHKITDI